MSPARFENWLASLPVSRANARMPERESLEADVLDASRLTIMKMFNKHARERR